MQLLDSPRFGSDTIDLGPVAENDVTRCMSGVCEFEEEKAAAVDTALCSFAVEYDSVLAWAGVEPSAGSVGPQSPSLPSAETLPSQAQHRAAFSGQGGASSKISGSKPLVAVCGNMLPAMLHPDPAQRPSCESLSATLERLVKASRKSGGGGGGSSSLKPLPQPSQSRQQAHHLAQAQLAQHGGVKKPSRQPSGATRQSSPLSATLSAKATKHMHARLTLSAENAQAMMLPPAIPVPEAAVCFGAGAGAAPWSGSGLGAGGPGAPNIAQSQSVSHEEFDQARPPPLPMPCRRPTNPLTIMIPLDHSDSAFKEQGAAFTPSGAGGGGKNTGGTPSLSAHMQGVLSTGSGGPLTSGMLSSSLTSSSFGSSPRTPLEDRVHLVDARVKIEREKQACLAAELLKLQGYQAMAMAQAQAQASNSAASGGQAPPAPRAIPLQQFGLPQADQQFLGGPRSYTF